MASKSLPVSYHNATYHTYDKLSLWDLIPRIRANEQNIKDETKRHIDKMTAEEKEMHVDEGEICDTLQAKYKTLDRYYRALSEDFSSVARIIRKILKKAKIHGGYISNKDAIYIVTITGDGVVFDVYFNVTELILIQKDSNDIVISKPQEDILEILEKLLSEEVYTFIYQCVTGVI